jgi:glycosyltransferase involved in cell wall biosynthesis
MNGTPLVSVIIPTYNRAAFLAEAVDTVLAQTFTDYELLIVDDGSTDRTAAVVGGIADPRVNFISLPHSGSPGRARNAGITRARGRYVAFLDSDDLWDSSKLDDQLAALAARPDCRWCLTAGRAVDETGAPHPRWRQIRLLPEGWILEPLLRRRVGGSISSMLVDRALLLEIGGFDETFLSGGEDYDLKVRLALRSPVARVAEPRVRKRLHAGRMVGEWGRPVLRTLGKIARSAPSWRLRSLAARELFKVGALYVLRRARAVCSRSPRRPVDNTRAASYHESG